MKYICYEDALKYTDDNKIVCIMFTSGSCSNCKSFINSYIKEAEAQFPEVDILLVDCDDEFIKFQPPRLPITYWYVPNCDMKVITREGLPPNYESMQYDLNNMVEIMNTGKSFNEVYFGTKTNIEAEA